MNPNLQQIMQLGQQLQAKMTKLQESLDQQKVSATSGGGMVTVTMTCRHDVRRVDIDDSLMGDDKEVLEDLIAAAVNDAVRKAEKAAQEKMAGLTAGLNIPGMNLPF